MVVCPDELPEAALVRIRLRGLTAIDGTIIWQHRGHAGVRFKEPLHQAVMNHLGFGEPAQPPRALAAARDAGAEPRRASGLHAQLVKRAWLVASDEKIAAAG